MSKKELFAPVKVFDPHNPIVPEEIKRAFIDGIYANFESNNESFHYWTVGDYQYVSDDLTDDDLECDGDRLLKIVDDWMLANGLVKGEVILTLYWW